MRRWLIFIALLISHLAVAGECDELLRNLQQKIEEQQRLHRDLGFPIRDKVSETDFFQFLAEQKDPMQKPADDYLTRFTSTEEWFGPPPPQGISQLQDANLELLKAFMGFKNWDRGPVLRPFFDITGPTYLMGSRYMIPFEKDWFTFATGTDTHGIVSMYVRDPRVAGGGDFADHHYITFLRTVLAYEKGFFELGKSGFALRVEGRSAEPLTFWILHGGNLRANTTNPRVPKAYKNAPDDIIRYVMEEYRKRLGLGENTRKRLTEISHTMKDRSIYFFSTPSSSTLREVGPPPSHYKEGQLVVDAQEGTLASLEKHNKGEKDVQYLPVFHPVSDHLEINGAAVAVLSHNAREALPCEMFTGFKVPRQNSEFKKGAVVEIGRYVVSRAGSRAINLRMVQQIAVTLLGLGNVQSIVVEADEAHAMIFAKYGFKPIHERQVVYEGKNTGAREFIMAIDPETLLKNVVAPQ